MYLCFDLYKDPTQNYAGINIADVKFDNIETKPYTANLVEFLKSHIEK